MNLRALFAVGAFCLVAGAAVPVTVGYTFAPTREVTVPVCPGNDGLAACFSQQLRVLAGVRPHVFCERAGGSRYVCEFTISSPFGGVASCYFVLVHRVGPGFPAAESINERTC